MATPKPKRLEFAASVDRAGRIAAEAGEAVALAPEWAPEHLVLAALCRCSLTSLAYHARRAGLDAVGSGVASGVVTRRESDGRYAFVELACDLDVEIEPPPDDLPALLAKAQRDCFVGASLSAPTRYRWRVNSVDA